MQIYRVLQNFNFRGVVGSLQYWEVTSVGDNTVHMAASQLYRSSEIHQGLMEYRATCLNNEAYIGPDTQVDQVFFAGLAAQTGLADQRTIHDDDQIMGQLVMPVFSNMRGHQIIQGVIEFITYSPKASYVDDFKQLYNLLKDENLTSPKEKTVKVEYENKARYGNNIIKFSLHWTSGINDLWEEVTRRFKQVNRRSFQIKYVDHNSDSFPIFSDQDLRACIADSTWNDMKTIKMLIA